MTIKENETSELAESLGNKKKAAIFMTAVCIGDPNEIRTRVTAVRGRCPRPLDDGTLVSF